MKTYFIENAKSEPSYQESLFIEMERDLAALELSENPNYITELEI